MPFPSNKRYGCLKAVISQNEGATTSSHSGMSHYNLLCITPEGTYQINIDIQSSPAANVKLLCLPDFDGASLPGLAALAPGYTPLATDAEDPLALDLIHRPLFDPARLADAPALSAGELAERLGPRLQAGTEVVVFGTRYDDSQYDAHLGYPPEPDYQARHLYGVRRHREEQAPPRGMDDVHLNQGTPADQYQSRDNGPYQDGALLVATGGGGYDAFFFAFSGQCFSTDAQGNCN